MHPLLTQQQIDDYQTRGVTVIRGLFADHVAKLRAGVEANMAAPGPYASENEKEGESGRFFDDYCNWQRIPEFEAVIRESPAAEVAAELMRSQTVQLFHDHVLVKEPGTSLATPLAHGRALLFRRRPAECQLLGAARSGDRGHAPDGARLA